MKITTAQRLAAALACVGLLLPQSVMAAPAEKAQVGDIALRDGGLLVGAVVDAQAKPVAESGVSLRLAGKEVARTTTDKNGVFAVKGLRGGQYQLVTSQGVVNYRLWAPKTAPPTARQAAMIVANDKVMAGQYGPGPILSFMSEYPFFAAGAVAAAIAIPVAVADDDDPSS
ncbi:MAG: carboxypeptidase-like regulatory domain-containing protein [Planctomycetota bacterium]